MQVEDRNEALIGEFKEFNQKGKNVFLINLQVFLFNLLDCLRKMVNSCLIELGILETDTEFDTILFLRLIWTQKQKQWEEICQVYS